MKIIHSPYELKEALAQVEGTIGFVPTMGALHLGHRSLIEEAKSTCKNVVVSIFVNPTQFLEGEDLDKYPRRDEADRKICELSGVDFLFYPQVDDMYDNDEVSLKAPDVRGYILEGASRPAHFDGVLTVVMKLFNIVKPDVAFFGKKDAQQLMMINLMVKQLFMDVKIQEVDTLRESDGLALSSRNIYLSDSERFEALKISTSLHEASKMIIQNIVDVETIKARMKKILEPLRVDYIAIVNREFTSLERVEKNSTIILVAAHVGSTHLIDNIWV